MTKRVLLGGILAGVVVFMWGAISHMALPLGEIGLRQLPNEEPVAAAMRDNIKESGLYFFPGMGDSSVRTPETQQKWEEKIRRGPTGLLVVHPQGQEPMTPKQLATELGSNIAAAIVAAILLSQVVALTGFLPRALLVGMLGLFSSFDILASYWNWYGFPTSFILASAADGLIGWTLAGLVLAAVIKPQP